MKQKITKINYVILLFSFFLECFFMNVTLAGSLGISIYNQQYNFIKVNIICISLDLIYLFYMLDFAYNKKKDDDIFKAGKCDVNLKIIKDYIFVEILKFILVEIALLKVIQEYKFKAISILIVLAISLFAFYVLYLIMPKKDNLNTKLRKLKKCSNDLKVILIDGETIPSSFEIEKDLDYRVSKDNLYINIRKDLPQFKNPLIKKFILENKIAVIHELDDFDEDKIIKIYEEQNEDKINVFHIMAIKKYKENIVDKKSINAIKLCDLESAIEFTENLFLISEKEHVKKSSYKKSLKVIEQIDMESLEKNELDNNEEQKNIYLENLNIIYQYRFNNRLKENSKELPKEKLLFELYRNSYLQSSVYQSILLMNNYITVMGKVVEYYLYSKYNPRFDKDTINRDIIKDNPPIWSNHILINIYNHPKDILYKNIREKEFELSKNDKILLKVYLSSILNMQIEGDSITFNGLVELFIAFRNKIEAHGVISDSNVYAIWNLIYFFAKMFNEIFMISHLGCEYSENGDSINIGYDKEKKINMGKYIIRKNKTTYFIYDKKDYIDYYTGNKISI